ncbi:histidine kinase [Methylobacterium sp. Leaf469]|jgi:signal transduction histidine kinase|uniref:response regulator n=1 Tax=unclassified Methylobacterium TaxID=2615210 RepID=UPI0006F250BD|nr:MULTISPECIES: response regulator [unclassified Methylobacterium]USU31550.1 response regulator [Methylobacterium sp. OTU13CASTA1]KQO66320.1 histidine kinase [Methylobacterium sp. Leaf87]KQP31548.1 histidine kinase [Methylobacterium sp. Leaf102]KQP32526.1 histidine kinase [Methylobacterium sp. Leaf100]KQU00890.1 histidine kinase [Methylobacterium sp. Leaf469]
MDADDAIRILHLEDSDLDAELVEAALDGMGRPYVIDRVMDRPDFAAAALPGRHDLILADFVLPTFDGISALAVAREQCPDTPFVFVSGTLGEETAVEALKNGAVDYITKQRLERLPRTVLRALAEAQAKADKRRAEAALQALNDTLELRIAERTRELATSNAELQMQIVERERVEEALRLAQRLEAVGQLTSGVAHDFNNLLTVISGNIEFLGREVSTERSKRRLAMMKGAADRGANLTAQLLAFSRRQRLEPTPVSLNQTVASMRDLLQSSIGGAVRIETTLQPDLWPALVDATQIELVILNLAINARDAMVVGGCLTIETANVTVTGPQTRPEQPMPGEYVMVAVSDTGTGMPPEVVARAFEPFFTTKEVGKGSGLGLAQAYGFVKQSGGGIRIDTIVGEGTSIRVYLPRVEDGTSAVHEAPHMTACGLGRLPGGQSVLLVVDDDTAVREVTTTRLAEAGHAVREAGSGLAGLASLEADPCVDLVVLDFAMPGMNGAEVATEIRKRWPSLPILFVTGYADTTALMKVGAVGADSIVQKPFRDGELERKVGEAIVNRPAPGLRLVSGGSSGS